MKTNQLMNVILGDLRLPIEHLTMMGQLNILWDYGNAIRIKKGLTPLDLKNYMRMPDVLEFALVIQRKIKCVDNTHLDLQVIKDENGRASLLGSGLTVIKTKRGRNGGTWAHLYILLDAAARLDPEFKYQVYEAFVTNKILEWRDKSGDEFNTLNYVLDTKIPEDSEDKRKVRYIRLATVIKTKILGNVNNSWNNATFEQLELRTEMEKQLSRDLRMGYINSFNQLINVIGKC